MVTNTNKHLAYRYGYCVNEKCDMSKKDAKGKPEIQQVSAHKSFVCSECQKQLHECPPPNPAKKPWKYIIIFLIGLLILCGIGFGVYALVNKFSGDSIPTAIKLDKKKITMKVGETIVLTPKAEPEGVKATFIFKKEKKEQSIKVSKGGEVTALKEGEAKVLIKCEENPDIRTVCKITIVKDSVKSEPSSDGGTNPEPKDTLIQKITTKEQSITMTEGQTRYFSFRVEPETFNELLLISSSDANIAEFDKNSGNLIAKKAGTAIITLKGEKSGITASVTVTVKKKPTGGGGTGGGGKTGPGTVRLSYGTYSGNLTNGVPNGTGKLTFSRSYRLNSQYTAQPGEYIQGIFENGVPTFVTYYQKDGTVTKIKTR